MSYGLGINDMGLPNPNKEVVKPLVKDFEDGVFVVRSQLVTVTDDVRGRHSFVRKRERGKIIEIPCLQRPE